MNTTSSQLKAYKRATSLETSRWYMASLTTDLADKKDTNGAFYLVEATLAPGNEPPPHEHSREDELFYVLEGELMCMWARKPSSYEQENASSFPDSCRTHLLFVRLGFNC